jgi:hypothetical protein
MAVGQSNLQERLSLIKKHKLEKELTAKNFRTKYKQALQAEKSLQAENAKINREAERETYTVYTPEGDVIGSVPETAETFKGVPITDISQVQQYGEGSYGDPEGSVEQALTQAAAPAQAAPAQQADPFSQQVQQRLAGAVDPDAPKQQVSGQPDVQTTSTISPVDVAVASPPASPQSTAAQVAPPINERLAQAVDPDAVKPSDESQFMQSLGAFSAAGGVGGLRALQGVQQQLSTALPILGTLARKSPADVIRAIKAAKRQKVGLGQLISAIKANDKETYDKMTAQMTTQQKQLLDKVRKEYPKAGKLSRQACALVGELLPALAGGGVVGAGKTILGTAGKLGALGAATGGAQFVEPGQTGLGGREFNTLVGGALGAAAGAVTGTLGRLARGFTKKGARIALAEGLEQAKADKMGGAEALQAGRRLGVDVPLTEATQHPSLLTKAKGILSLGTRPKAELTSKLLGTKARLAQRTTNMIDNVLKNESRTAIKARVDSLMRGIQDTSIPQPAMKQLLNNPTIANNIDTVIANPNLQGITNKSSFRMMDIVKKQMRAKANKLKARGEAGAESKALDDAAKQVDEVLKTSSPEYRTAAQLSQRYKVYDKWTDKLAGIAQKAGKDRPSLQQIYTKMFDDDKVFKELVKDLSDVGVNPQVAKDLRLILNRLSNSPLGKLMGKQTDLVTGMAIDQGPGGVAMRTSHALFKRRYNKELVRIMTSGKWDQELADIARIKSEPQMLDRLAKLLTVVGTKTPGMATRGKNNKRNK